MGNTQCNVCGKTLEDNLAYSCKCETPHHKECIEYNGKCSVYGCDSIKYKGEFDLSQSKALVVANSGLETIANKQNLPAITEKPLEQLVEYYDILKGQYPDRPKNELCGRAMKRFYGNSVNANALEVFEWYTNDLEKVNNQYAKNLAQIDNYCNIDLWMGTSIGIGAVCGFLLPFYFPPSDPNASLVLYGAFSTILGGVIGMLSGLIPSNPDLRLRHPYQLYQKCNLTKQYNLQKQQLTQKYEKLLLEELGIPIKPKPPLDRIIME